ncbi:hypothetical protein [Variovorax sp. GB1P17]|uniref:hypothetical protein n=1 Tax=Variovorax sp. GB1P17 TaxID=3443740 RepID=UPI003F44828B
MDNAPQGVFSAHIRLPVLVGPGNAVHISAIVAFRQIDPAAIDAWLMPGGRPRSDRELAADVLLEIREVGRNIFVPPRNLDPARIVQVDQAASLIVSSFLSLLPRPEPGPEPIITIQSLRRCVFASATVRLNNLPIWPPGLNRA